MSDDPRETELDRLHGLLETRDRQRAAGAVVGEDAAERMARALLGLPPGDLTCAAVQSRLPALIEAELRGAPPAPFDRVLAHLRACPECSLLHDEVLAYELAAGQAGAPETVQPPLAVDLGFLRTDPFERLRAFVTGLAEEIMAALQPAALAQLSYLLDPFFENAGRLPRGAQFRPALAAAALGLGGQGRVRMPVAGVYLGACFLAVRELGRRMTPEQIAALQAAGRLEREVRQLALRSAADAGLRQPEAARFADEFARRIVNQASELPPSIDG